MRTITRKAGVAVLAVMLFARIGFAASPAVGIAIVRNSGWSTDTTRDGAAELALGMRVVRLQRSFPTVGLICLGDRHGTLERGGERALRRAALSGVVVVKLANGGSVAPTPDNLFLDGGALEPTELDRLLTTLLERQGPAPAALNPDQATAAELAALQSYLEPIRQELAVRGAARVAVAE